MRFARVVAALVLFVGVSAACGDDDTGEGPTTTSAPSSTTTTSTTTTTTAPTSTTSSTTTTSVPTLEQPAIWPAADVVFDTPQAAAADFVSSVLGVPPELGEFQQGDSRSGEIEVLLPAEGASSGIVRSLLLLRQLGPDNGWFVLAAINDQNTITSPASMAEVAAGPLEVSGDGRGFEGLLVVEAFVAGDAGNRLDQQTTQGGSMENTEPFSVTVDLSGAESGQTVLLLVRGGVGLETDPGEFSAIPVVIGRSGLHNRTRTSPSAAPESSSRPSRPPLIIGLRQWAVAVYSLRRTLRHRGHNTFRQCRRRWFASVLLPAPNPA